MIIWSGWGILAPVVAALVGVPVLLATGALFEAAGLARFTGISLALGLFAGAAAVWFLGRRMNDDPGRELVDPRTGERVLLRRRHSLFFIPMQWWAVPLAAAGVIALIASIVNPPAAKPDGAPPATTRTGIRT